MGFVYRFNFEVNISYNQPDIPAYCSISTCLTLAGKAVGAWSWPITYT